MKGFRINGQRKQKLLKKIIEHLNFLAKHGVNAPYVAKKVGLYDKPTTKQLTGIMSRIKQFDY